MRIPTTFALLLLVPSLSLARSEKATASKERQATVNYVLSLQQPNGGFAPVAAPAGAKPAASLRATSAAARALKYLSGKPAREAVPHADKAAAFVLACHDPKAGGFADTPGGKPDAMITAVGVMAAVEFEVPREKFAKALDYLKENAKAFEQARLGAAGVEAWGVKESPFDLKPWLEIAEKHLASVANAPPKEGGARETASAAAMLLRLGSALPSGSKAGQILIAGQRDDGGWGKAKESGSDLETTYRVMRAFYLLKAKPKEPAALRGFIAKCRNADGGYGVRPGEASNVGAVYYAAIVTHWLDEMEKK